jgi:tetratricopeptide (TPR) repeat protein
VAEEAEDRAQGAQPDGTVVDPAAMAIALGASSALDPRAAAFLEKQGALSDRQSALAEKQELLLDLEIADRQHEDRIRHWSLRVRHVSDVLKLAFEFSLALFVVALVLGCGAVLWGAAHDDALVIEAFPVPPDMAAKGVTGEVVASKVQDRLSAMQAETNSTRAASSYANNWDNDIKVQVPDTGVSIGEINKFLHEWLGHQTHIRGEVYRTANAIAVTARTGGIASGTFTGADVDLDALIDDAARSIFRSTQPYRYALYLRTAPGFRFEAKYAAESDAILEELVHSGSVEDRAWSYDGIGMGKAFSGDLYGGAAMIRRAIATKPTLDAYTDLANNEQTLQHDEDVLTIRKQAEALAARGGNSDMKPSAAFADALFNKQHLALVLGDNLAALDYGRQIELTPGNDQVRVLSIEDDLLVCGALHDSACLRQIRDSAPPASNALDASSLHWSLRLADILLGRFKEAADEAPVAMKMVPRGAGLIPEGNLRWETPVSALIRAEVGDFKGAYALIDKSPADCDMCTRFRGRIDALERNWTGADYWFARAVALAPSIPFAYADWGAMLLQEGNYDAAIAKFKLANQKGPHFADPLEMWGEALMLKNRSDLALTKFEEADKYAPNWGRLHLKWGEALFYAGHKDEARKQFAIAARLDLTPSETSALAHMEATHG